LQWNRHSKTFWTLTFELPVRNIAWLYFKTERLAATAFRASWFWPSSAPFPGTWGIFSDPGDSKVTPNGLALQWNGHSKTFWTLIFELLGRNIAPLYFKTKRVTETALRALWFWPTSARFPGTWRIFSSPGDSKLTPNGLRLHGNWRSKTFWTHNLELLGRNIAPLDIKIKRVADTALHASWFWPTSARFPGTGRIFYSLGDCKLTPDGFGVQWNGQSKTFWTVTFELLGRNTAPLHLKTERVAETALRASWFWRSSARCSGIWGIFSSPWDSKVSPDGPGLQWIGHSITFRTLTFELLGRNIAPLHLKTERVAETALRASWFWQTSARFPGTWGIFWCLADC